MSNRRRPGAPDDFGQQLSSWPPRRIVSWSLFALALLVAVQHLLAHSGWRPLPMGMGWQDVFLGYPAAGVLAIAGLMALDPRPPI